MRLQACHLQCQLNAAVNGIPHAYNNNNNKYAYCENVNDNNKSPINLMLQNVAKCHSLNKCLC